MGIFSSIKEKIFGKAEEEKASPTVIAETAKPVTADVAASPATSNSEVLADSSAQQTAAATPAEAVDVAAVLDAAVKKSGQKLDWRRSIVDLMKALGMDASLQERKELADELGYKGDKNDSATMNIWLHKALVKALSENGGKVPADLLD